MGFWVWARVEWSGFEKGSVVLDSGQGRVTRLGFETFELVGQVG